MVLLCDYTEDLDEEMMMSYGATDYHRYDYTAIKVYMTVSSKRKGNMKKTINLKTQK